MQEDRLGTDCKEGFFKALEAECVSSTCHCGIEDWPLLLGCTGKNMASRERGGMMFLFWILGDTSGVLCLVWALWDSKDCVKLNCPRWSGLERVMCEEMLRELVLLIW